MSSTKRPPAGWLYLAAFITIGMAQQLLGPALTYLRGRTGSTKGEIAILFVASSIGYLVGSLSIGKMYDRGLGHRGVALGLFGIAGSVLLIPQTSTRLGLSIVFGLIAMFGGFIDVGGNTLVVWYARGSGSNRLLNALHLFFGFGALIAPVLVNRSLAWTDGLGLAAGVVAVYSVIIAVLVLAHAAPTHSADDEPQPVDITPRRVLAVIGVFFFLYVGIEVGFSGWIKTYAEGVHLPGGNAPTILNTLFFATFTLGRFLAVILAKRVTPGMMLVASCSLTSALLIVMIVANGSPAFVWITTALIGLAIAPQFATMIAFVEQHMALTGRATSWLVSAAGLGGLFLPYLIGQLLDDSSSAMPIVVFCGAVLASSWIAVVRRVLIAHQHAEAAAGQVAALR